MAYPVVFYENSRQEKVVETFLEKQNDRVLAEFFRLIDSLAVLGPKLTLPDSKRVYKDIDELRITGREQIRIFYTFKHNQYYLLHAFKKKTRKTPVREVEVAINRLKSI